MTETYRTALIVGVGSGLSASLARMFAKAGLEGSGWLRGASTIWGAARSGDRRQYL